jgi:hypothetical protein
MTTHETGGHPADQPTKPDQPANTETSSGDTPSTAEDPSNRESRGTDLAPDLGPPVYQGGNMGVDTRLNQKMNELQEKLSQWEEKLKVVLKK